MGENNARGVIRLVTYNLKYFLLTSCSNRGVEIFITRGGRKLLQLATEVRIKKRLCVPSHCIHSWGRPMLMFLSFLHAL